MKKIIYCLMSVLCLVGCQPSANDQLVDGIYLEDPSQVRQALKRGADPYVKDKDGDLMAETLCSVSVSEESVEILDLLLKAGLDPNIQNADGESLLMQAAGAYSKQAGLLVKLLLENGADPNILDKKGRNALTEASFRGNIEAIQLLLAAGVNPNSTLTDVSALYMAVLGDKEDAVRFLLENGADPRIYNKSANPLAALNPVNKNKKIEELLLQHGAKPLDY